MKTQGQTYLVLLLDRAVHRTFTQIVRSFSGLDAGAYALSFDDSGERREDGYEVLAVLSSSDLRRYAGELDAFTGPVAPSADPSKIEFEEGIVISE